MPRDAVRPAHLTGCPRGQAARSPFPLGGDVSVNGPRVLIVEDDESIRIEALSTVRKQLELTGVPVLVVTGTGTSPYDLRDFGTSETLILWFG